MDSNDSPTASNDDRQAESLPQNNGLTKKERRKHQNRHNQRVWRSRQKAEKNYELFMEKERELQAQQVSQLELEPGLERRPTPDFTILTLFIQEQQQRDERKAGHRIQRPEIYQLMRLFESSAHRSYMGNPNADHRLTLVKLDVFRAFVSNITALGYSREWMADDSLSRFNVPGPHPGLLQEDLPASLQPTSLQRSQPHHPWLDFFPFPKLRDILITHEDNMDDVQLCRDLMGFYTMPTEEDNCMLVWGDPWNPMNWEVTETFLRKWGWIVKGCPEIIWSTNHWRRIRGQRRIRWKNSVGIADSVAPSNTRTSKVE